MVSNKRPLFVSQIPECPVVSEELVVRTIPGGLPVATSSSPTLNHAAKIVHSHIGHVVHHHLSPGGHLRSRGLSDRIAFSFQKIENDIQGKGQKLNPLSSSSLAIEKLLSLVPEQHFVVSIFSCEDREKFQLNVGVDASNIFDGQLSKTCAFSVCVRIDIAL
jgi:hypothetical protein